MRDSVSNIMGDNIWGRYQDIVGDRNFSVYLHADESSSSPESIQEASQNKFVEKEVGYSPEYFQDDEQRDRLNEHFVSFMTLAIHGNPQYIYIYTRT